MYAPGADASAARRDSAADRARQVRRDSRSVLLPNFQELAVGEPSRCAPGLFALSPTTIYGAPGDSQLGPARHRAQ
jgi:hypothetical protein